MLTMRPVVACLAVASGLAANAAAQCEQQLQKLVAPDGGSGRQFGYSLAVSGDWMVIGAPYANDPALRSGAVYLYHRGANGQWAFDRKLTSNDAEDRSAGLSVALTSEQALFTRSNACIGKWVYSAGSWFDSGCYSPPNSNYVIANTVGATDRNVWWSDGSSLQLVDRDYNGIQTIASGRPFVAAIGRELAVFGDPLNWASDGQGRQIASAGGGIYGRRYGGYWVTTNRQSYDLPLQALDPTLSAYVGASAALHDRTAALGAYNATSVPEGGRGGAAYVFDYLPGTSWWTQTAKLTAQDWAEGDLFGYQVAFNEAGNRLAVTAPWKDTAGPTTWDAGCVYVFERDGASEWTQARQFFANDAGEAAQLGISLAYSGGSLFVGAPGDSQQGADSGAVYVFSVDPQRPSVDGGPGTATVRVGQTAVFDVTASGAGSLTYQWRRAGVALTDGGKFAGSRTPHLRVRNCHWADVATFDCVVSNSCGSTTSPGADLVVLCPADFNNDSFLDFFDYDDFIQAFQTGEAGADFNADGFIDFFDYDDFVAAFEAGC